MKIKWLLVAMTSGLSNAWAAGYGIYDPRALALGGAGVAMGNSEQGFHYNPALTAFHETSKNKGRDSRFYLPGATLQVSDAAIDAVDISDSDLDQQLTDAIDRYNLNGNTREQAANAYAITREIDDDIDKLQGNDLSGDIYAGMAVVIPSEYEGGSVSLGSRLMGGGHTNIKPEDRELLRKYLEFFDYASSHDTLENAPHPELYDVGSGQIGNPKNSITSNAVFRGAAITELGVSAAGLVSWQKADIAFGATPKAVQTRIFDEERQVVNETVESKTDNKDHLYLNLDLGVAARFDERLRLGFAVKDALTKRFVSSKGNTIELAPRYRMGLAYEGATFIAGLDLDLKQSQSFAGELTRQDLSLGAEWHAWRPLWLRAGYRYDMSGNMDGTFTLGAGVSFWRVVADMAYGFDSEGQSGALQLGVKF